MDLVSGCLRVGRPQGTVRVGSIKDLLDLFENPDVQKQPLYMCKKTYMYTSTHACKHASHTYRQTDGQTGRQAGRQTHIHICVYVCTKV